MKTRAFFILLLVIFCAVQSYAQEEAAAIEKEPRKIKSLLGNDAKIEHGGWGAFTIAYTRVGGKDAILTGGRGGWLINHRLTLGFGGHGFSTEYNHTQPTADNYSLSGGYGGFLVEPIISPFEPFHISIPILIGGGNAGFTTDDHYYDYHGTSYFVFEPGIDLEVNIVKFFRLAVNISYRFTSNLYIDYYSVGGAKEFSVPTGALRGFNAGLAFKFGKF